MFCRLPFSVFLSWYSVFSSLLYVFDSLFFRSIVGFGSKLVVNGCLSLVFGCAFCCPISVFDGRFRFPVVSCKNCLEGGRCSVVRIRLPTVSCRFSMIVVFRMLNFVSFLLSFVCCQLWICGPLFRPQNVHARLSGVGFRCFVTTTDYMLLMFRLRVSASGFRLSVFDVEEHLSFFACRFSVVICLRSLVVYRLSVVSFFGFL